MDYYSNNGDIWTNYFHKKDGKNLFFILQINLKYYIKNYILDKPKKAKVRL